MRARRARAQQQAALQPDGPPHGGHATEMNAGAAWRRRGDTRQTGRRARRSARRERATRKRPHGARGASRRGAASEDGEVGAAAVGQRRRQGRLSRLGRGAPPSPGWGLCAAADLLPSSQRATRQQSYRRRPLADGQRWAPGHRAGWGLGTRAGERRGNRPRHATAPRPHCLAPPKGGCKRAVRQALVAWAAWLGLLVCGAARWGGGGGAACGKRSLAVTCHLPGTALRSAHAQQQQQRGSKDGLLTGAPRAEVRRSVARHGRRRRVAAARQDAVLLGVGPAPSLAGGCATRSKASMRCCAWRLGPRRRGAASKKQEGGSSVVCGP